ncbi:MAG: F0F1 ATP synthase subunit B [Anaerolineae bacterium]|nr:F0F1 ATP synthase subunit B [Anaerolineae bacterium]
MEKLGINGGFLLAQIVNFLLLFGLLTALAWRPLIKALEARRERIAKGLEDARLAEQARANAEREAQKLVDQRRAEAQKLVEEGRARGDEQAKTVLADAQREAEEIRQRARAEAEEERNATLGEVRSQVAQLAVAAAERVLERSLDEKTARGVVSDFFGKLPAEMKNLSGYDLEVTSALPLTDAEQQQIRTQTGANSVTNKVDPDILGGMILRAGDQVVDLSAKNRLQGLKAQMR